MDAVSSVYEKEVLYWL